MDYAGPTFLLFSSGLVRFAHGREYAMHEGEVGWMCRLLYR